MTAPRDRQHAQQALTLRQAGAAAAACDRAALAVRRALLTLATRARRRGDAARVRALLSQLPLLAAQTLRHGLLWLYLDAHRRAALHLVPHLPRRLREDREQDEQYADLLLPPPPEADILAWLSHLIQPGPPPPEGLVEEVAAGLAEGDSQHAIAQAVRPYLDDSRVRSRRLARTWGLYAGHAAQRAAWEGSGLVIGYRLQKTTVPDSRWWHRERVGMEYFFDPPPGKKGMRQCPHPPLEPEDPAERPLGTPRVAWHCLCYLEPILNLS